MLMIADDLRRNLIVGQKLPRSAGVLGGYKIHTTKYIQGTDSDIPKIAYWRPTHVQGSAGSH